jgi:hypothetical protein
MTIRSPKRSALPHAESSSADTSRKNNLPDASVMGGNYLVQVLRVQACSKDPQAHQTANHNCQMPAFGLTHAHRQLTGCRRWRDRRALIARPQWAAMEIHGWASRKSALLIRVKAYRGCRRQVGRCGSDGVGTCSGLARDVRSPCRTVVAARVGCWPIVSSGALLL